jgi:polar amino acid transport system substrate-binding protein
MKLKVISIAIMAVILLLSPAFAQADQLADIKSAGKIVVGSDTTYAPFESIDETSNKAVGFDVDLAMELGERMGVTVEIKTVVWDTIIPSLQNEEFDVIISAMTITSERALQIDFSIPYYNSSQGILVADGNPKGIEDETDLESTDIKIGVQLGTTSDIYVTENENIAESQITRLANFDELYLKLENGEIDVILGDAPVIGYAAAVGQSTGEVVGTFGDVEPFGIGIRKGETALKDAINGYLEDMFDDGTYNDLVEEWFNYRPLPDNTDDAPFSSTSIIVGFMAIFIALNIKRKYR